MRGSGHSTQAHNAVAREAYVEAVRGLRDITIEDMGKEFSLQEMVEVDRYHHTVSSIGRLVLKPLPETLEQSHGNRANMLADNTTIYDDEGEDLLADDEIIRGIIDYRSQTRDIEATTLFRVRRSVVAYILSHWIELEELQQSKKAG